MRAAQIKLLYHLEFEVGGIREAKETPGTPTVVGTIARLQKKKTKMERRAPYKAHSSYYQAERLPVPLAPPFSAKKGIVDYSQLVIPTAVQKGRNAPLVFPEKNMARFLAAELRTPKLDKLHNYLWLAALPLPARPLQRQRLLDRAISLTETPDEHLVWHRTKLLLKPLPDFLLCHEFWTEHLCSDPALHQSAAGLLLSYSWLIGHRGDFILAQSAGLVPDEVDWPRWNEFIKSFLESIDLDSLAQVDRRYHYGELRLSRLNSMTRFLPSMWSRKNFVQGYLSTSTWYQAFFERNFAWLLPVFVYISLVLSAMQVGLATQRLNGNLPFEQLSYGVALLAIAAVFLGIGMMLFLWLSLFCYHFISTILLDKRVQAERAGRLVRA